MNSVNLVGRLTKDPEVRITTTGTTITRFSLAVNHINKDKEQKANFIPCVAFNKLAETIGNHVAKGQKISVTGQLRSNSYVKNGERRSSMNVCIKEFQFCESKKAQ